MGGVEFGNIDITWAFRIFKERHKEPAGKPVARIAKQLNALGAVIERESEYGRGAAGCLELVGKAKKRT